MFSYVLTADMLQLQQSYFIICTRIFSETLTKWACSRLTIEHFLIITSHSKYTLQVMLL